MLPYIAMALSAGSILVLAWALAPSGLARRAVASLERLEKYDTRTFRRNELSTSASVRILKPVIARMAGAARLLTPSTRLARLQAKIEHAGRPWNLDLNSLLAFKFACLAASVIVLLILASVEVIPGRYFLFIALVLGGGAYYIPNLLVHSWGRGRKRRIYRALPDFLDLLTVTVEAGLGLEAAFARIADKMRGPLKEEVLITLHHMRIGQSRDVALREFAQRCDLEDLERFVTVLIQSQRLGTPLGRVLRTQADQMRTVRRQRIEEAARKAPIKLLFPLVLCIFPALFVVILGPSIIKMLEFAAQHM